MRDENPIFNPMTHYRIEIRGPIDAEWLQGLSDSTEFIVGEAEPSNEITVLDVSTDQAGIVGLVRKLHAFGMTIQQLQVIQSP